MLLCYSGVVSHHRDLQVSQYVVSVESCRAAWRSQEPEVSGSLYGPPYSFVSPSADSRRAVVSYWQKCVHEVLVNRLDGLSLPRKSVNRPSRHDLSYLSWT